MRFLLLLLACAGCVGPVRRVDPADPGQHGGVVEPANSHRPIRPSGSVDSEADETRYLLSDGVHKITVRDGEIVSSEPVPGGLPGLEAQMFAEVSAREAGDGPGVQTVDATR